MSSFGAKLYYQGSEWTFPWHLKEFIYLFFLLNWTESAQFTYWTFKHKIDFLHSLRKSCITVKSSFLTLVYWLIAFILNHSPWRLWRRSGYVSWIWLKGFFQWQVRFMCSSYQFKIKTFDLWKNAIIKSWVCEILYYSHALLKFNSDSFLKMHYCFVL